MDAYSKTDPSLIWPDDPAFRNFPKRLPDDCVEYTIHVLESSLNNTILRSRLLEIQRAAGRLKKDLLKGYIWQREAFGLALSNRPGAQTVSTDNDSVDDGALSQSDGSEEEDASLDASEPKTAAQGEVKPSESQAPLHLRGQTSYGDSIADEWLIVYLLRTLSQQFPQTWTQVWDSDGQFLLIEAANVLPDWLDPDVSENRVWMHEGRLKIVPLGSKAESSGSKGGRRKTFKLMEALAYLQQHALKPADPAYPLLESDSINAEAFNRIRDHPASISSNMHTTTMRLPRKLAYLVNRQPQWASPAIEAFYLRDPIAMQPLQGKGSLTFPPEDMVDVPLKMQRVGFAQLKGQDFEIPKAWAEHKLKLPLSGTHDVNGASDVRRRDTGMKLTCGFEMLLSDPAHKDKQIVREIKLLLEDLDAGEEVLPSDTQMATWRTETKEDSEDWLNIDWASFEKELKGQQDTGKSTSNPASTNRDVGEKASVSIDEGFGDKVAQENLRRMVAKFEGFLKSESEDKSGLSGQTSSNAKSGANRSNSNERLDDEEENEDDDASFAPSDESESEFGSSEEEGWGSDEDYADEADDENDTNDPKHNLANEKSDEDDLNDTDLEAMMKEMKSMGLSAPPAPRSSKENDELREALMALADIRPDPSFKPTILPDTKKLSSLPPDITTSPNTATAYPEAKQKARARADTTTAQPARSKESAKHARTKSEPKAKAPSSPQKGIASQPQSQDSPKAKLPSKTRAVERQKYVPGSDSEADEIEEISRNMHDADLDSLSSDSEVDHLDPAGVKSFEELFGRELREAGVLK